MAKVAFRTADYEFCHGVKPRGVGNWGFFFHPSRKIEDVWFFFGSYTDAKKMAAAEAKRRNVEEVFVGS